jgi:hypothetical protein
VQKQWRVSTAYVHQDVARLGWAHRVGITRLLEVRAISPCEPNLSGFVPAQAIDIYPHGDNRLVYRVH